MNGMDKFVELAGAQASATLTVDLGALRRNYRKLKERATPAACGAAVKADAYGTGLPQAVKALADEGCRDFFVAQLSEGLQVRSLAEDARIYVLNGLAPGCAAQYAENALLPVMGNLAEIREWTAFARTSGAPPLPAALHVDTGINRLGLTSADADALLADEELLAGVDWRLLMSHLACADAPEDPHNKAQVERFQALRERLPAMQASLANSGGTLSGPQFHFDLVRPGIALFGGNAFSDRDNEMEVVVRLEAPVMQVREIEAGERVGYSGLWTAEKTSRIAVIQVGYGDGYLRNLGSGSGENGASVFVGGEPAPVVGRVSMDMITVDVTHIAPERVQRGSMAEIIGNNISVDAIAARAGTISYEVLTRLGSRFRRIYVSGD